jgi:glycosyltransferase involved in cell wall biosynthesis
MNTPEISVIIPTYNRALYLGQALDSVFAQTFPAAEIIVIDDGSTDQTRVMLDNLIQQTRIRYVSQSKKGVSSARNRGIELASHPFIAFLDSDDLFLPSKLEKQIAVFKNKPELGFVHCNFSKFNDQGDNLGIRDTSRISGQVYPNILMEWSVFMAMPCMVARTEVLKEVGGFDESMAWAEDMDLWRRIAKKYAIDTVPEVLVKVRVHSTSTSFDRIGGVSGFEKYLEKAFEEDHQLSRSFKQKVRAKMYVKFGQNLLGEGDSRQMSQVRTYQLRAFQSWPFQLDSVMTWIASFVPLSIRNWLINAFRRRQYPIEKNETL